MAGQNRASMRKKLRSALAHKKLADEMLDALVHTQEKLNATFTKLNAEVGVVTPAVAAIATLDLTADVILTSVATGTARNTTTLTTQVLAAAANPTNTVLVSFTGTAAAIVVTITPNDGTNNSATPVDLTTADLVELINAGAVTGKTITLTDADSLRTLQTATGGDTTAMADAGEGDGVVGTFAAGANISIASFDTNYVATGALTSVWDSEAVLSGQSHATVRKLLRSALAHRRLADEMLDAITEIQTAYTALLVKLDAEAGTVNDANYVSTLAVSVLDAEHEVLPAQHAATARQSLRSAAANIPLADMLLDTINGLQGAFNAALANIDAGTVSGTMDDLVVSVIEPDVE